jgi:hypothetical protein
VITNIHRETTRQHRPAATPPSNETSFSPKWKDYDVMKNRWKYIKPQTKRFVYDNQQLVPTTSHGSTIAIHMLDGQKTQILGRYVDAEKFRDVKLSEK